MVNGNVMRPERHTGLWCGCLLLECCHNEDTDEGDRWRAGRDSCGSGQHVHSGSAVSGGTQPWEPGDESWRDACPPPDASFRRSAGIYW